MNRSWVRFPQAAQKRPPLQGWTLSSMYEARAECAGEHAVGLGAPSCGRTWLRVPGLGFAPCHYRGRAAWCARGRRPARSPSAPRALLGASARCPARPCRRPRASQPGPPAACALVLVGFFGLQDKTCWFCGDFSAVGAESWCCRWWSQRGGWTNRVASRVTFWLCCAGKSLL